MHVNISYYYISNKEVIFVVILVKVLTSGRNYDGIFVFSANQGKDHVHVFLSIDFSGTFVLVSNYDIDNVTYVEVLGTDIEDFINPNDGFIFGISIYIIEDGGKDRIVTTTQETQIYKKDYLSNHGGIDSYNI